MSASIDRIDPAADTRFFDGYTRVMLSVMFVILMFIFASGKYMSAHKMEATGTDDKVNNLATQVTRGEHHPFIDLPGDAQVGAFSIANFFAGLIVGHHWTRLFGTRKVARDEEKDA
ncbi:MAG: hypothetical protein JO171_01320 [Paludibacterium sp.]|uniref:hypothetical protein n=1 Tax=Paludibacterium sp. TaxID=1917523 RepID=UPI0025D9981A|nr:hypothetical protein [Paludibacterium sp.]MBV8045766.1 hypothetical protein [Paludibacterium sp.]MBV8649246.1 hypothetical protein [Paludibacterium sp.]